MANEHSGRRPIRLAAAAALLALAGCDEPAAPASAVAQSGAAVSRAMSYEVAIAIATAERNRAIAECNARPAPERGTCVTVARANWESGKAALDDLRGDQR